MMKRPLRSPSSAPMRCGSGGAVRLTCGPRRGKFELAKQLYSKCLEANSTAVGYANRAMACLKLGHNLDAESDCTEAIALDARSAPPPHTARHPWLASVQG